MFGCGGARKGACSRDSAVVAKCRAKPAVEGKGEGGAGNWPKISSFARFGFIFLVMFYDCFVACENRPFFFL